MQKVKTILVAGGYGGNNLGDEAQCAETLKILTNRYPNCRIINLTPNIEQSKKLHPEFFHDLASRVALFNQNEFFDLFSIGKSITKIWRVPFFWFKAILVFFNAYLVKFELPTFLLNAKAVKYLVELNDADLFYFCGCGCLTGHTLSRLWDGFVFCKLCEIFDTPVVMSGQTIGLWCNKFNEILAKWAFKPVKIITVRDEEFSLNDLEKIGIKGEHCFATHDDALYCDKSEYKIINDNNYVVVHFHYWGMKRKQREIYIDKINKIVNYIIDNTNYNIVFIPMTPTDKDSFDDYLKKYPNDRIMVYEFNLDFRKMRRVIADSKMCITMKHHPIIFAMGEDVPTIGLYFSHYYKHKNVGALSQYGLEKFSVNLEENGYYEQFMLLFNDILINKEKIISTIKSRKKILNARKEKFLENVDLILK